MSRIPTELHQSLFASTVDRLQVYGLDRLTAMNAANEAQPAWRQAYTEGVAAGRQDSEVMARLRKLVEEHAERRRGDSTYDTARAVLADLMADLTAVSA